MSDSTRGKDFKFDKYIPDSDDIDAYMNVSSQFFSRPYDDLKMNDGEKEVFLFESGFYRGIAWAFSKLKNN